MQHHEPTRAYVTRRTYEGKTEAEIIRCLKRLLARETWALLRPCGPLPGRLPRRLDGYRSVNALMESVIGLFKTECIRTTVFHAGPFKTLDDVEYATAGWVDWWNNRRLHGTLKMITSREAEQPHYAALIPQEQPV